MGTKNKEIRFKKYTYTLVLPPNLAVSFSNTDVGSKDRILKTTAHETESERVRFYRQTVQVTHVNGECIEPDPIRKKELRIGTSEKLCDLKTLENEYYEMVRTPAVATVFFSIDEVKRMRGLAKMGKQRRPDPSKEPGVDKGRTIIPTLPSDYDDWMYFSVRGGQTQFLIYSPELSPPYEPVRSVWREDADHSVVEDYFFALDLSVVAMIPLEDTMFRLGENGVLVIRGVKSGSEIIARKGPNHYRKDIEREIDKLDQSCTDGSFLANTLDPLRP